VGDCEGIGQRYRGRLESRALYFGYGSEYHYIEDRTMNTEVSAADANRRFSELLRAVKEGRTIVVTSHGKPVAKISPLTEDKRVAEGARSALFARLRGERAGNAGRWTRDELYDDAR
jgi:prevent-host-death family protein